MDFLLREEIRAPRSSKICIARALTESPRAASAGFAGQDSCGGGAPEDKGRAGEVGLMPFFPLDDVSQDRESELGLLCVPSRTSSNSDSSRQLNCWGYRMERRPISSDDEAVRQVLVF